jgi:uncharacterized protein YdeI (YjbR/CyaY-like superfamily)
MARKSSNSFSSEFDAYIADAASFAQPILKRIRRLFHQACPAIQEELKWGHPSFVYKGIVGGMAAFKQHVSFGFWKEKLLSDPYNLFSKDREAGMFGSKLTDVSELPPDDVLISYVCEAVALNEAGKKIPKPQKSRAPKEIVVPPDLRAALKKNKKAAATFDAFSYSKRKDYVEWITEAKQEATRQRRLATAIEWLSEGKSRNWKYEKC